MANDKLGEFVKAMNECFPESINGAVVYHLDEKRQIKSISPLCQFQGIQDMYQQLSQCRDAIQAFLNDLVNKGLAKGGQLS